LRWGSTLGAILAVASGVVAIVHATGSSVRLVADHRFPVPVASGCSGVTTLASGALVVPITVRRSGSEAEMFAEVCVDGSGPFPFIIDTGAATTIFDSHLAERLHLPKVGRAVRGFGVGCSTSTQPERVAEWSVAGEPLSGQMVAVQTIPGLGRKGEAAGLLGADTLSRFGAIRFDFGAQTMMFPGPQSAAPKAPTRLVGPLASPIPGALLSGPPSAVAGLIVLDGPTFALAAGSVKFRGTKGGVFMVVDTGSSRSVIDSSVTRVAGLAGTDSAERQSTVCSVITAPLVRSGPWSVGDNRFVPLTIGSTDLGELANIGALGLLGLDELSRYQYVILDFKKAALAFGPLSA
jgi:hypothetical protein